MKLKNLVSKRYREAPADFQITSQALMMRGGYIKPVGNGIYSLFPPMARIANNIEAIIREEMNRIDGQEVLFPVAMPASLWEESGRYFSVGSELVRFKDRSGGQMVLGMTHEEAAVHLARDAMDSYAQYPFMIYQIQTKFRDEPRARGGLIRVREFRMKDGYSYHATQEDLEAYFARVYGAYERIFKRVGLPSVVAVSSDSGMMGGKVSNEFMLPSDFGEDTIALCDRCGYRANLEAAPLIIEKAQRAGSGLAKVSTPGVKTIEDLCAFLGIAPEDTIKAVAYRTMASNRSAVAFVRGDLEVNETKLANLLREEVRPDAGEEGSGLEYGFMGPKGLAEGCVAVYDESLRGARGMAAGANEPDAHYTGFDLARDAGASDFADIAKIFDGAICPDCGERSIRTSRGIELGHIFQLGDRYAKAMGMRYSDSDGELKTPVMGCYGIGIGRLAAAICEANNDANGPIWPMPVAPWKAHICSLRADSGEVAAASRRLYDELAEAGIDALWDDRAASAGVMFADADLLGVPVRAIVSPKGLAAGEIEIASRDKSRVERVPAAEAAARIIERVGEELRRYG